jgi:hypothetical protein
VHLPFERSLFSASDWAIELKLLMATIDRRLVAGVCHLLPAACLPSHTRYCCCRRRRLAPLARALQCLGALGVCAGRCGGS